MYLVSHSDNGLQAHLFTAKRRVASIKNPTVLTIPHLELCGAVIFVKFLASVLPSFVDYELLDSKLFTDAHVDLHLISTPARRQKVYFTNRVTKILEIKAESMRSHISTDDNPADIVVLMPMMIC